MLRISLIFIIISVVVVFRAKSQVETMYENAGIEVIKDEIDRYYLAPQRIVWKSHENEVKNASVLLKSGDGQTRFGITSDDVCQLTTSTTDTVGFVLDFGIEIHGAIQITTATSNRVTPRVRIRFGESVSETMSTVIGDGTTGLAGGATNHHAMRDFEVNLPGYGTLEIGNSGFRFVRIDLIEPNARVAFEEIRAVSVLRDIPYLGSFNSSDTLLNQIWKTGAYTVHVNMQDYLWDGIKRDRMVWMGDMHPELMTICSVFGNQDIVRKSLDFGRDSYPLPKWMNGISAYSMWWIIMQYDWYMYQGDLEYLGQQEEYLSGLLKLLMAKVDEEGRENLKEGFRFLDWPSSQDSLCVHAGLQALMVMSFEKGSALLDALGDKKLSNECSQVVRKMKKYVPNHNGCKQGAALASLAGIMDAGKANDEVIAAGGVQNFSTFYGYYMLQAKALAGDYQGGINNIRTFWGKMLEMGATTFWEDFNMEWTENAAPITAIVPPDKDDIHADFGAYCYIGLRHSLCHGWSSGPTAWLSQHVLGITPLEPGCKSIRIEPHLGDLDWVEGTFPTPFGLVKVMHRKTENGQIVTAVEKPDLVQVVE